VRAAFKSSTAKEHRGKHGLRLLLLDTWRCIFIAVFFCYFIEEYFEITLTIQAYITALKEKKNPLNYLLFFYAIINRSFA